MKFPKVIAHRGMPGLERENTLPSFQKAIEAGAKMIEFDVRLTADGVMVINHDPHVVSGADNLDICDMSYQALNSLIDYHIPTLEEVLKLCAGKINLDIELKETGYEENVLNLVLNYYQPESFMITSFHDEAIKAVNQLRNGIATGLLFVEKEEWDVLMSRVKACGAGSLAPHYWMVDEEFMTKARRENLGVYVWTVDEQEIMEKMVELQVDGIISDFCDMVLALGDLPKK